MLKWVICYQYEFCPSLKVVLSLIGLEIEFEIAVNKQYFCSNLIKQQFQFISTMFDVFQV